MNIESIVGILYCLIGIVHLVIGWISVIRSKNFTNPEAAFLLAFAWPIVDAVWIIKKLKLKRGTAR